MNGTLLRHAEPEIPVQLGRHGIAAVGPWPGITPVFAAPAMDFLHFADRVPLDDFNDHPVNLVRMDLDAHLGDKLLLGRHPGELTCLVDRLRERLLRVDVQAPLHGAHCDRGVHVVRRRNIHRIEVLLLVEKFAQILIDSDVGKFFLDVSSVAKVHIGDRHELDMGACQ